MGDGDGDDELPEPVRLDVNVDAYVPVDYIPYEQAKVDVHRRIAGARDVGGARGAARGAGRPLRRPARAAREPDHAAAGADQARRGRRAGGLLPPGAPRGDADRARLRARQADPRGDPRARSTSPASRSSPCACPTTRRKRFPAVVRAADVLLEVQREPLRGPECFTWALSRRPLPSVPDHEETICDSWRCAPFLCRPRSSPDVAKRASRATRSPRSTAPRSRRPTSSTGSTIAAKSSGQPNAAVPEAAGVHRVHRAGARRPPPSRPRASRSRPTRTQEAVPAAVRPAARPGAGLLISFEWIDREAKEQGVKVDRRRGQEVVRGAEEAVRSRRKPTTRSSSSSSGQTERGRADARAARRCSRTRSATR